MQGTLWPAFVLHSRPYQENKQLLSLIMPELGRCHAILRRRQGKQQRAAQPFQPYLVSLGGRSELKTLYTVEEQGPPLLLSGRVLFSGFYLNELVCRIWPADQASEQLYRIYYQAIRQLSAATDDTLLQLSLRCFELALLTELGVMPDLSCDHLGEPVQHATRYRYIAEQGLVPSATGWSGQYFLALQQQDWQHPDLLQLAKQLNRQLLQPLLGDKPLQSRALFQSFRPKP